MKKRYYMLMDVETCNSKAGHVFDFAVFIVDRKGNIHSELSVLIPEHYQTGDFFNRKNIEGIFNTDNMPKRIEQYQLLIDNGNRLFACVTSINNQLDTLIKRYSIEHVIAYNVLFDRKHCTVTGITALDNHKLKNICLWNLSANNICITQSYLRWAIKGRVISPKGIIKTSCDKVHEYLFQDRNEPEPHTAREDLFFELDVFKHIIKLKCSLYACPAYNWRNHTIAKAFEAFNIKL